MMKGRSQSLEKGALGSEERPGEETGWKKQTNTEIVQHMDGNNKC